ncbi:VOC family protein [Alcaligenes sp. WGS1538]|uniref:VOC family protein n=1 Tax=Alcaligenes sp. WGS1538 TaxID=3366811 RepID=UPI00372D5D81
MNMKMVSPLEVGISCRDLPALRRFYEDVLDFQFVSEFVVPADKARAAAMSAAGYTVVRLQTSYGERIKLIQAVEAGELPAPTEWILDRPTSSYLTFIVADIDAAIARLQAAGASFMTGPGRIEVRPGVYLAFCRDPEGNVLELVEYADIREYRNDLDKRN